MSSETGHKLFVAALIFCAYMGLVAWGVARHPGALQGATVCHLLAGILTLLGPPRRRGPNV